MAIPASDPDLRFLGVQDMAFVARPPAVQRQGRRGFSSLAAVATFTLETPPGEDLGVMPVVEDLISRPRLGRLPLCVRLRQPVAGAREKQETARPQQAPLRRARVGPATGHRCFDVRRPTGERRRVACARRPRRAASTRRRAATRPVTAAAGVPFSCVPTMAAS